MNKHNTFTLLFLFEWTHACGSMPTSVISLCFLFTHSCFHTFLLLIESGNSFFILRGVKYFWKPLRKLLSVSNTFLPYIHLFIHRSVRPALPLPSIPSLYPTYNLLPLSIHPSIHSKITAPQLKGRQRENHFLKKWSQRLHLITSSRQITHESLLIWLLLCPICPSGSNAPLGSAVRPDQLLDPPPIIGPKNKKIKRRK